MVDVVLYIRARECYFIRNSMRMTLVLWCFTFFCRGWACTDGPLVRGRRGHRSAPKHVVLPCVSVRESIESHTLYGCNHCSFPVLFSRFWRRTAEWWNPESTRNCCPWVRARLTQSSCVAESMLFRPSPRFFPHPVLHLPVLQQQCFFFAADFAL